jgi:phage gp36-like protein
MAYITDQEFEQAFGDEELADLTGDGSEFAKVAEAASSLINGYIASKYTLPLLTVPDVVKGWALDITRYRLWDEAAPAEVRRRYEDALQQLRDLAAGRLALPPGVDGTPSTGGFESEGFADERVFTATTLEDF